MSELNKEVQMTETEILADAAKQMLDVIKTYTYNSTDKKGKKVTKKVVRKYSNKKETSNTLQNKANKELVTENIKNHLNKIKELDKNKRMNYIKENCLPENITASYNTLNKILNNLMTEAEADVSTLGLS